ncbi:MAG: hypothetical protein RL077_2484 [Verrucomicrobiota bacterium]
MRARGANGLRTGQDPWPEAEWSKVTLTEVNRSVGPGQSVGGAGGGVESGRFNRAWRCVAGGGVLGANGRQW